jgi:hypothetical protein
MRKLLFQEINFNDEEEEKINSTIRKLVFKMRKKEDLEEIKR